METLVYILIGIAIVCCICNTIMYLSLYTRLKDILDYDEESDDYNELNKKVDALFTLVEQNTKSILVSIDCQTESVNKNDLTTYRRIDEKTNDVINAIADAVDSIKSQLPKRKTKKDTTSEK